jgi:cytochrome c biogenesis protein CcmG/thiol:disulfide interchange protein DsbE
MQSSSMGDAAPEAAERGGLLSILVAAGVVGAVVLVGMLAIAVRQPGATLAPGEPAPSFTLVSFEGQSYELEAMRGQVVLLNFWASWCVECEDEAADLEAVWREYKDRGLLVLGVDYTDTEPAALAYLERFDISYPNGPDLGGRISRRYGLTGVPETVLIDAEGRVAALWPRGAERPVAKIVGPILPTAGFGPQQLRERIEELLSEAASAGRSPERVAESGPLSATGNER